MKKLKKVKIYGHRGCMGTIEENTLAGFKKGIEYGIDGFEIDVHMTKDGEIVVIHDDTLDRTTNGTGYILDYTLNEIKELNIKDSFKKQVGHECLQHPSLKIPTLQELLQLLMPYEEIDLNIELKTADFLYKGIEEKVLNIVGKYGGNRKVIYSSFHLPTLLRLKNIDPEVEIAFLLTQPISHPDDYVRSLQLEGLHVNKKLVSSTIDMFRNCGNLRVWTINDEEEIERALQLNIDAIITNFPERAIAIRDGAEQLKIDFFEFDRIVKSDFT